MTDQRVLSGGKKIFGIILFGFSLILFFALTRPIHAQEPLPQPYLLFPSVNNYQTGSSLPIITGETRNDTLIDVYFDNQLAGQAMVANGPLLTGYFTFRPTKNLAGGDHDVYVIAKDKNDSQITSQSSTMKLHIWAFPKPTLFPVSQYANGQPIIQGVAKNDSMIRIFADGQLQATFPVANHPSGTASFSWTALSGQTFSATATDPEGKASSLSNLVGPGQPALAKPTGQTTAKPKPTVIDNEKPGDDVKIKVEETPTEGEVKIIGNGPIVAMAKTFNKKSFWLWGLLAIIVIAIVVWLRKNLNPPAGGRTSGEIIGQEINLPTNKEAKTDLPTTQPEPQLNLPIEPVKTENQPPTAPKNDNPPTSIPPPASPAGRLDNF